MAGRVRVEYNPQGFQRMLDGAVADAVNRATGKIRDRAKANITAGGRVATGKMRNATVSETAKVEGATVRGRVVTETSYAQYQHDGTGIHGPKGRPIVPRRARVLRFQPKGGAVIFRPQVQGTRPLPFLKDAVDQAGVGDFLP